MKEAPIQFNPLPVMNSSLVDARGTVDFERANGNLSDALLSFQQLQHLVLHQSVFLDEGAYQEARDEAAWEAKFQATCSGLERRIAEHDAEKASLQQDVATKDKEIRRLKEMLHERGDQIKTLQEELENNSNVFRLHHEELLLRNKEIERLNLQLSLQVKD